MKNKRNTGKLTGALLGVALMVGLALPVSGYHIDDKNNLPAGDEPDVIASTASGSTIITTDWWAGNSVFINVPAGGGTTFRDVVDGATSTGTCDATFTPDDCDTELVPEDIVFGLVICERNPGFLGVALPAAAGWSGRCTSSIGEDNGDSRLGYTADGDREPDSTNLDPEVWNTMDVFSTSTSTCASSDPGYFARVGNNAHGLEVPRNGEFRYRENVAFLVSSGHVTYFINADELGSNPATCFGWDTHCRGDEWTCAASPADAVPTSGTDVAVCNDLDSVFTRDAFVKNTYVAFSGEDSTVTYSGVEMTVCSQRGLASTPATTIDVAPTSPQAVAAGFNDAFFQYGAYGDLDSTGLGTTDNPAGTQVRVEKAATWTADASTACIGVTNTGTAPTATVDAKGEVSIDASSATAGDCWQLDVDVTFRGTAALTSSTNIDIIV